MMHKIDAAAAAHLVSTYGLVGALARLSVRHGRAKTWLAQQRLLQVTRAVNLAYYCSVA